MKKILGILLTLVFALCGCSASSTVSLNSSSTSTDPSLSLTSDSLANSAVSSNDTSISTESSLSLSSDSSANNDLESQFSSSIPVTVETYDIECVYLQQNVSDNMVAYGVLTSEPSIVSDIEELIWLVMRGFHNSGYAYKKTAELPEIAESESLQSQINDSDKGDIEGTRPTLIRIVYKEHSPKGTPAGGAPSNYKDIVLFVDSQNSDNMIFARQVLDQPGTWETFEVEGFGQWLEAEMDMIYRNYFSEYYRD